MAKRKYRDLDAHQQHVLEHGHLERSASPEDIARCDSLIVQHHYLHDLTSVGEHLRYALVYPGQWLALATWSSAALHLKDPDAFIGWTPQPCSRRRALPANNSGLLVLPGPCYPNLSSRFMKLMLARLSLDWQQHWDHPLALVETFVDARFYQGTAYKVSGWSHLGRSAGWKRGGADLYPQHHFPKPLWVRQRSDTRPTAVMPRPVGPQNHGRFYLGAPHKRSSSSQAMTNDCSKQEKHV